MCFTPDELAELRLIDDILDHTPLTAEDWRIQAAVDDLLFPERVRERERRHRSYMENQEAYRQKERAYYQTHKEQIAARKRAWYQRTKEIRRAVQLEYYHKRIAAGA